MKFCYVDETGSTGKDSIFCMAGIVIDFTKIRKADECFCELRKKLFSEYSSLHYKVPDEIKTSQIYEGKSKWGDVSPDVRKEFIENVCNMVENSSHKIFFSLIDFERLKGCDNDFKKIIEGHWKTSAIHMILQVQYDNFNKNAKNCFVLIFDDHVGNVRSVLQILNENKELHEFYSGLVSRKRSKELKDDELLNKIIETLSVESKSSALVQFADVIAYVLRRYYELQNGQDEIYDGDSEFICKCFEKIDQSLLSKRKKYWDENSAFSVFCGSIAPNSLNEHIKL